MPTQRSAPACGVTAKTLGRVYNAMSSHSKPGEDVTRHACTARGACTWHVKDKTCTPSDVGPIDEISLASTPATPSSPITPPAPPRKRAGHAWKLAGAWLTRYSTRSPLQKAANTSATLTPAPAAAAAVAGPEVRQLVASPASSGAGGWVPQSGLLPAALRAPRVLPRPALMPLQPIAPPALPPVNQGSASAQRSAADALPAGGLALVAASGAAVPPEEANASPETMPQGLGDEGNATLTALAASTQRCRQCRH